MLHVRSPSVSLSKSLTMQAYTRLLLFLFHLISLSVFSHGSSPPTTTCNFIYNSFQDENTDHLRYSGDARIFGGAVQVSLDSLNSNVRTNSWGWVVDTRKLQFKLNNGDNHSASFNTTFHINLQVSKTNKGNGGGMAFMLVPYPEELNKNSERSGKWLGLYSNSSKDLHTTKIVGIELDTYRDEFDDDDNHVGLDLNGIQSFRAQPLRDFGINLSDGNKNITVWIDYDGRSRKLDVFMVHSGVRAASNKREARNVLSVSDIDLGNYTSDVVYAGFAASSGDALDLHCLLSWEFSMYCLDNSSSRYYRIIIGIIAATATVIIAIIGASLIRRKKNKRQAKKRIMPDSRLSIMEVENLQSAGPRKFTHKELSKATGNFKRENKLGSGASGTVYKGTLHDKTVVAVKRISYEGVKEFVAEVSSISKLRHRNLVPLIGWSCHVDYEGELLLVYPYMPKGSLDQWLYRPTTVGWPCRGVLDWGQRYKVLCGTAAALVYLHEGWEQTVIHRDVKASNIMLDSDYTPRLGDFGLARVAEHGLTQLQTINPAGTPGYIPPEVLDTRMVTKEADVYSFGMVVLEVACGRRPISNEQSGYLLDLVWELYLQGKLVDAADSRLANGSYRMEDMVRVLKVGLSCANPNPRQRPSMSQVLQELTLEGPCSFQLPPSKPRYRPQLSIFPASSSSLASPMVHTTINQVEQISPQISPR